MREQRPAGRGAVAGVLPGLVPPGLPDVRRFRHVVRAAGREVVAVAGQRRDAAADAAGIEANPVVRVAAVVGNELPEPGQAQTGPAGPAGIHEHDALVVGVGDLVQDARDHELDLGAVRFGVVKRHGEQPALGASGAQTGGGAVTPRDRRRDIALGRVRSGCAGRGGCGGGVPSRQ